jgi:two-component system sensor histidine kinase and response regulator WspE
MRPEELLEFIFLPGFSTAAQVTEISGRGVGLDIARSMAREVGGSVRAMSQPGQGMSFHFQLPLTLSVLRTLLVEIAGEAYAFPLARIDQIAIVPPEDIAVVENRQYFVMDDRNVGLVTAHQVLELAGEAATPDAYSVVVISDDLNQYGVVVDRFLGERDLVVRPLDARLGKVQDINAAALREDGSLVLIVDTADLVRSINRLLNSTTPKQVTPTHAALLQRSRKRVLIADDSITVREMERKILENQGYHVDVAVDGMDAWNSVRNHPYDLLITDVDMPRMTGIELVTNIRQHPALYGLPIAIVSYKDQEGDRLQGLEAGADAYLTKTSFQDDTLVQTVVDLIGPV